MEKPFPLLNLPPELLALLPPHLANVEDFTSLSSTCRTLRTILAPTSPNTILRLAAAQSRIFFRPDPYFLVAATIDQVASWALLSEDNTHDLRQAIKGGIETLFELCVEVAGLTMERIRSSHLLRFSVFNPTIDLIDRCAGKQWYDVPNFWSGGRSDAETIDREPSRAFFEITIYGSLFKSTLDANLDYRHGFSCEMRLDFIKYCIPDWYCESYEGFEVEKIGPYNNGIDYNNRRMDQYSIRHILKSRTWGEKWKRVRDACGGGFEGDERRQKVWENGVVLFGLDGFEMLFAVGGVEKWRPKVIELRRKIEKVSFERMRPGRVEGVGGIEWLGCPVLADEILCCVRSMWGYT